MTKIFRRNKNTCKTELMFYFDECPTLKDDNGILDHYISINEYGNYSFNIREGIEKLKRLQSDYHDTYGSECESNIDILRLINSNREGFAVNEKSFYIDSFGQYILLPKDEVGFLSSFHTEIENAVKMRDLVRGFDKEIDGKGCFLSVLIVTEPDCTNQDVEYFIESMVDMFSIEKYSIVVLR